MALGWRLQAEDSRSRRVTLSRCCLILHTVPEGQQGIRRRLACPRPFELGHEHRWHTGDHLVACDDRHPLGALAGAASVQVPLALLTPTQAETVEARAAGPVVITPSRGLVLPGAARHLTDLAAAGLVEDPASPWSALSCVGAPSCQKSLINTRVYAAALAQSGSPLQRTHISGCERRCGAPAEPHQDLVAPAQGKLLAVVGPVP